MNWDQAYNALSEGEKEDFARILSQLFEQTYLLRDTWDMREQRLAGNRDYWFVERVFPIFDHYLRVSGFELQQDAQHGVMGLYNRFGKNRIRLDKYTTYLLYALRIVYDEQMEQAAMRKEVIVSLRESLTKLNILGLLDRRLTVTNLMPALKQLRRRQVLGLVEGDGHNPDSRWMIYPTITLLVTDVHINALYDQYKEGTMQGSDGLEGWEETEEGQEGLAEVEGQEEQADLAEVESDEVCTVPENVQSIQRTDGKQV